MVKNTGDGFLLIFTGSGQAARWSMGLHRSHLSDRSRRRLVRSSSKSVCMSGPPLPNPA